MKEVFLDLFSNEESVVDEGYFTGNGFYSSKFNESCNCNTREEHYKHLTHIFILIK